MAKRLKLGDVVEIPTSRGLAYAHYTHASKKWGSLLRVLTSFHQSRPADFLAVVNGSEAFRTFFPLQAAVNRRIFQIVANEGVPGAAAEFPLFRAAGFVDRRGIVHNWYLWDGEEEWPVEELADEQYRLPLREIINDTLLIERLEEGWTPYTDQRSRRRATD